MFDVNMVGAVGVDDTYNYGSNTTIQYTVQVVILTTGVSGTCRTSTLARLGNNVIGGNIRNFSGFTINTTTPSTMSLTIAISVPQSVNIYVLNVVRV